MNSDVQSAFQALASSLAAASEAAAHLAAAWSVEPASSAAGHDLSVHDLAERLGRSASAVREWVAAGLFEGAYRLPGVKRAGAWRIPVSAVERFTERQQPKSSRQGAPGHTIATMPRPRPHPTRARDAAAPDLSAWRKVRESRPR